MDEVKELLDRYLERFGEPYPTMVSPDDSYETVCQKIRACLETGEPYEFDLDDGILY